MKRKSITAVAMAMALLLSAVPATANETHGRTFKVTVTNLTDGQPMTPPVTAIHHTRTHIFRHGTRASEPVEQLAENGNFPGLAAALDGAPGVRAVTIGGDGALGGGATVEYYISAERGNRMSLASMIVCTNDGITGVDSLRVPKRVGDAKTVYSYGYDAGSEINNEVLADIVPPCSGDDIGSGMSDPALEEDNKIVRHAGILNDGTDDSLLNPATFGWDPDQPVMMITVERVY